MDAYITDGAELGKDLGGLYDRETMLPRKREIVGQSALNDDFDCDGAGDLERRKITSERTEGKIISAASAFARVADGEKNRRRLRYIR